MVVTAPLAWNRMQPFFSRNDSDLSASSGRSRDAVLRLLPKGRGGPQMSLMGRYRTTGPCGSPSHDANAISKVQCKRQKLEMGGLRVWTVLWAAGCGL